MIPPASKRILVVADEPALHAQLQEIHGAGETAAVDAAGRLSKVLADVAFEVAWRSADGIRLVRESVQQFRPYLLAVIDHAPGGQIDTIATAERLWSEDSAMPLVICVPRDAAAERHAIMRQLKRIERFLFVAKPFDPGEVWQALAIQADRRLVRDELQEITGRLVRAIHRAREETEAASRAKSEFIANISHELRTPMNAILGFTRLLMREPLSDEQLRKLQYVQNAGTSLLNLINNVLDYARLIAGQLQLSASTFHVESLVADALMATAPSARSKGLSVGHYIADAVPRRLRGDKTRLQQVLVNLVDNAIKFTNHGDVHVQIFMDEQTPHTATIRIVVTDTGVGIPLARQSVVFDGFSQADGSATRQFEGVGLGLAICKHLVELMGGQIGFRSEPERGSSFWVTVTLDKHLEGNRQDGEAGGTQAETTNPSGKLSDWPQKKLPRVLVADDDYLNRTLAEMLLVRAGYLVTVVCDGREALGALNSQSFDLVLMDMQMPEFDGAEVIRVIRQQEAATGGHLPIVALTACAFPGDREECLAAGADVYLLKPLLPEQVLATVHRYLPGTIELDEPVHEDGQLIKLQRANPSREAAEEQLQALARSLETGNQREVEAIASAIRKLATECHWTSVADQTMRLQLAVRSGHNDRVPAIFERLKEMVCHETDFAETMTQSVLKDNEGTDHAISDCR